MWPTGPWQRALLHQLPIPCGKVLLEAQLLSRSQRGQSRDEVRHREKEPLALPCSSWRGSWACLLFPVHDVPQDPGARLLPELQHRLSPFRRGPPPSVLSQAPAACTHSRILKTNRRLRLPAALAGLPPARASQGWEVCWQGPGGTHGLSPLACGAGASAHPAPAVSASRSLSLPPCHPQSCDAVSGLHCSDSSVELTA